MWQLIKPFLKVFFFFKCSVTLLRMVVVESDILMGVYKPGLVLDAREP